MLREEKLRLICWGDEIDLFKNGLYSTFYIVNACAQAAFLVGDVMLLTMAFNKVKRNGGKPAVQNLVYVCNINFMLCLCLVYEATSCVKKQKSFCACVYDVRIVLYDWSNNRSQQNKRPSLSSPQQYWCIFFCLYVNNGVGNQNCFLCYQLP